MALAEDGAWSSDSRKCLSSQCDGAWALAEEGWSSGHISVIASCATVSGSIELEAADPNACLQGLSC